MKLQIACADCATGTALLDPETGHCVACGQLPGQLSITGLVEGEQ